MGERYVWILTFLENTSKFSRGDVLLLAAGLSHSSLTLPSWVSDWSLGEGPDSTEIGRRICFQDPDKNSTRVDSSSIRLGSGDDELVLSVIGLDRITLIERPDAEHKLQSVAVSESKVQEVTSLQSSRGTEQCCELKARDISRDIESMFNIPEEYLRSSKWPTSFRKAGLPISYIRKSPKYTGLNPIDVA